MSLSGQVALVTGAARGIGRGVALALAKAGADVCVNYRSSASAGAEVVGSIRAMGLRALLVQADVSDRGAVERMVPSAPDWGPSISSWPRGDQRR
jgi:NAD(P)-dependent dehydrogenase (short-subunit alcohol dehydrogenase family)